jgi:hypothetical protein
MDRPRGQGGSLGTAQTKRRVDFAPDATRSVSVSGWKRRGEQHDWLPVPSLFLGGKDGTVKFAYSNPDYRVHLKGQVILAKLLHARVSSSLLFFVFQVNEAAQRKVLRPRPARKKNGGDKVKRRIFVHLAVQPQNFLGLRRQR